MLEKDIRQDDVADQGSTPLKITVVKHDGSSLEFNTQIIRASRGYPAPLRLDKTLGSTNRNHPALFKGLRPGKHVFVAGQQRHNATIFDVTLPSSGLETQIRLRQKKFGTRDHPDLNVMVKKKIQEGSEILKVTINNNRKRPYALHETDLSLCMGTTARVFPPESQQNVGLIIPPRGKGDRTVTLKWAEYVKSGIWVSRHFEVIDEPWLGSPPGEGQVYIRVNVGITGSIPISVSHPEIVLSRREGN